MNSLVTDRCLNYANGIMVISFPFLLNVTKFENKISYDHRPLPNVSFPRAVLKCK